MNREKFIKPIIEVIKLSDDIICTSEQPQSPFDPFPEDGGGGTDAWD